MRPNEIETDCELETSCCILQYDVGNFFFELFILPLVSIDIIAPMLTETTNNCMKEILARQINH